MDDIYKTKQSRCKHALLGSFGSLTDISFNCKRNGINDDEIIKDVSVEQCENCPHFKSKFIEYPLTINGIDVSHDTTSLRQSEIGKLVRVRPCNEDGEESSKTYVGIFLGDLPHAPLISHDPKSGNLKIIPMMNPAMFVPELKRIVYGYESWWSIVNKPEDLDKEITDELIQSQWYVQLAKALNKKE